MSVTTPVGIDLGTTFSCVAYYNQGKAEVIPDKNGDRIIPSFVYYNPNSGEVHVGKIAYELATHCPANGLRDIKRIIGRRFDDEFLVNYRKSNQTSFSLIRGDDDLAVFEITIGGKKMTKSPAEASSEILKYLKNAASAYLNTNVTEAVISIPAYFSNAQRKATKKAAELAGLNVLKLITEPIAAAVHYINDKNVSKKLLVFDWGGGTLDISRIYIKNKTFEVKSVCGDTLLGGRNIDEILFKHFYIPVSRSPIRFIRRLLHECINIKELLSVTDSVTKVMDYVDEDKDITLSMTRSKFEYLTSEIFERIRNILEVELSDTAWSKSEINNIVLVGGSTRIPKVSEMLQSFFGINNIKTDLNPDEAVACGASIHAALLKTNSKILTEYVIKEVTPFSMGIKCDFNRLSKLFEKNSPLPIKGSRIYGTSQNDQRAISLDVFEGERANCIYNNKLGTFTLNHLPPGRAGDIKILINFDLDEDGILTVSATQKTEPSNSNSLTVTTGVFKLSEHKTRISIDEKIKSKIEDDIFNKFCDQRKNFKTHCMHILYDLNKISSSSEQQFVKTKCDNFLNDIGVIKFTEEDRLQKTFKLFYDSILDILEKSNMLELEN